MSKSVTMASWDDVPHLDEKAKAELLASIPPYQRDARSKGVPQLGSGAIYPVSEDDYVVEPFDIPPYWPRGYGLDVGWKCTAAVFGAHNRETDCVYLYDEVVRTQQEPSSVATAIKARGTVGNNHWMQGVIDPAARGRSQRDGERLIQDYIENGLNITPALNAREAGLYEVYLRITTGRLKVFKTLAHWRQEVRLYRRDDKGQVVKVNDHAMDATRYMIVSGVPLFSLAPNYLARQSGTTGHTNDYDPLA